MPVEVTPKKKRPLHAASLASTRAYIVALVILIAPR